MITPKPTEQDLAAHVVAMLHEMGWEVFQEVETGYGRADIVARRDKIIWVVECKMSFGLSVIEQAWNYIRGGQAHYVSVAVPYGGRKGFCRDVCRRYGIGVLTVNMKWNVPDVKEEARPSFNRKASGITLKEEHKTWCKAGSACGGHYTPFKGTVQSLVSLVTRHPEGLQFSEAIKKIDHHYSSFATAKTCLRGFIGTVIPELRVETVGGKLMVFINEGQEMAEK